MRGGKERGWKGWKDSRNEDGNRESRVGVKMKRWEE